MNKVKKVYTPILSIFNEIASDNGLFDLLNCSFLADNIGNMLKVFGDSGQLMISIGACLGAISLLNWFVLFFGLIIIFRQLSADKLSSTEVDNKEEKRLEEEVK